MIVFVSVIGIVLLVVIVMFLRALYYETVKIEAAEKLKLGRNIQLSDLESTQLAQLGGYEWVDPAAGRVALPIERAMEQFPPLRRSLLDTLRAVEFASVMRVPPTRSTCPGTKTVGSPTGDSSTSVYAR